jgi:hypothetical protein
MSPTRRPHATTPAAEPSSMDETQSKATFVALSQALTGIPGSLLAPSLDPTKILDTVYNAFVTNADPCAAQLILESFQALKSKGLSDDEIATAIIADPATGPLAASITKLWLLGNWYPQAVRLPRPWCPATPISKAGSGRSCRPIRWAIPCWNMAIGRNRPRRSAPSSRHPAKPSRSLPGPDRSSPHADQ